MRTRPHRRLIPLLLAFGSLVLLTGCSEWGPPPGPQSGGTMRVSVPSLPVSWNPDSATDATSAQLDRDVEAPLLQLTPHTQQAASGIAPLLEVQQVAHPAHRGHPPGRMPR